MSFNSFGIQTSNNDVIHTLASVGQVASPNNACSTSVSRLVQTDAVVELSPISAFVYVTNQLVITAASPILLSGFSQTFSGGAPTTAYYQNVNASEGELMSGNMSNDVGDGCTLIISDTATSAGTFIVQVQKAMLGLWSITITKL